MNAPEAVDFTIQWSIRVSLILVYTRLIYRLWRGQTAQFDKRTIEYSLWLVAFLFMVLHVCVSFHFVHQWAHNDAWDRTAIETQRITGLRSGYGIWANYLMLAVWSLDLIRNTVAQKESRTPSLFVDRMVAFFFAFMFINATAVFGPTGYRYLVLPALIPVLVIWLLKKATALPQRQ